MMAPASWDVMNPREIATTDIVAVEFHVASQSIDTTFGFLIRDVAIT